jgi:hypothetical protein
MASTAGGILGARSLMCSTSTGGSVRSSANLALAGLRLARGIRSSTSDQVFHDSDNCRQTFCPSSSDEDWAAFRHSEALFRHSSALIMPHNPLTLRTRRFFGVWRPLRIRPLKSGVLLTYLAQLAGLFVRGGRHHPVRAFPCGASWARRCLS